MEDFSFQYHEGFSFFARKGVGMKTEQAKLKEQAYASSLKSRALSVLIYLIDRSNQELTCFPAISTMAEQLHISVSTVKRALRELVDEGYISKEARFREKNRGQSSNLYTLMPQQKRDGVGNNDSPDAGKDSKSATDNSSSIKEEQKQDISDGMPQGTEVEHIGFENLKKKEEGEKKKGTLRDCYVRGKGTIRMEYPPKKFNIVPKKKSVFYPYRCLLDCTLVHFWTGSFSICLQRIHIFLSRQVNGRIRNCPSVYCLFLSWMGEGVSLHPP